MNPMLRAAHQLKHAALVARKRVRPAAINGRDALFAHVPTRRFDVNRYRDPRGSFAFDFFLDREAPDGSVSSVPREVPRVIHTVWAGHNEMSDNRRRGLDELRRANPDIEVRLVTPENLDKVVLSEHPLHPSYEHLSAVHRSDYLRGYLMHHHGGGYADIKPGHGSWSSFFDRMAAEPSLWMLGYPELSSDSWANLAGPLARDLRRTYVRLSGSSAFIARPGTALTAEWLTEVERRLDYYSRELARWPATDPVGQSSGYPVTWIGLQADVFGPVQLKHLAHVATDPGLLPAFTDYR